jgi:hypothetical protein
MWMQTHTEGECHVKMMGKGSSIIYRMLKMPSKPPEAEDKHGADSPSQLKRNQPYHINWI